MYSVAFYEWGREVVIVKTSTFEEVMSFADLLLDTSTDENSYCVLSFPVVGEIG